MQFFSQSDSLTFTTYAVKLLLLFELIFKQKPEPLLK